VRTKPWRPRDHRSPSIDENLAVLERYGVIKRQGVIDAEVLEESDAA